MIAEPSLLHPLREQKTSVSVLFGFSPLLFAHYLTALLAPTFPLPAPQRV